MRRSLGIAVFSGMLGVTLFGIFLTPIFFNMIQWGVDSDFFREGVIRWGGSALLGGVLGGVVGYSLANLGVGVPARATAGGIFNTTVVLTVAVAFAGALLALILPSLWRRITKNGPQITQISERR
jgi:multidrug efflux pump